MDVAGEGTEASGKEPESLPSIDPEISEPAAAFQRELYRAADARVLHLDQQAAVLIAAAIALAGYGASALGGGKITSGHFVGLSLAAVATIAITLWARFNHPCLPTKKNVVMRKAKAKAETACRALDDLTGLPTVADVQGRIHDAWRKLVNSSDLRRAEKQKVYLMAIATLLIEVGILCYGLIQGAGS